MVEELRELIINGNYIEARNLANRLFEAGEQSEEYWILNATLYQIEGVKEAEYACISRGLQKNPSNYELYYMLGNYYREQNINQAYLCYEQAEYYCTSEEDLEVIRADKNRAGEDSGCQVQPVSIVILSYNIKEIMQGCIQSIRDTCPAEAYELVVVDNASTDGIAEWLRQQTDIVLQCNMENKGFAAGCNQGIEMAAAQNDIMLLNNDTIVPPNAVFWLRMGLYERESVGAVSPITNYASNNQALAQKYDSIEEYIKLSEKICVPLKYPYEHKIWLMGFAMLVKRAAVNRVGGLDTRYEWGNYEDDDYGLKLTQAGYELLLCHNSFIYHYGSLNMTKDVEKYAHYMRENYQKFIDKWNFRIQDYSSLKIELIQGIKASSQDEIKVLDIGCGYGASLARIKYMYPKAEVYGIEENPNAAVWGAYMGNILAGDIQKMKLPYSPHMFDYILFSGEGKSKEQIEWIYEHMPEYLKPQGEFLTDTEREDDVSALVDEEKYREKVIQKRQKAFEYLKEIDSWLESKTEASVTAFVQRFLDTTFVKTYVPTLTELGYAHLIAFITFEEIQKRQKPQFILNGASVAELTKILKEMEFRLWEVEFQCGEDAEERFYDCMERYHFTPEAIKAVITAAGMFKKEAYLKVALICLEHRRTEEALLILRYGAEEFPQSTEILGLLVQLCEKLEKHKLAEEYAEKLKCVQQ